MTSTTHTTTRPLRRTAAVVAAVVAAAFVLLSTTSPEPATAAKRNPAPQCQTQVAAQGSTAVQRPGRSKNRARTTYSDSAQKITLDVAGTARVYYLCIPPQALTRQVPLVVVTHGWTHYASTIDEQTGWSALGARQGVAVAFPEGYGLSWNAWGCCGNAVKDRVDDIAFIEKVVSDARTRGNLSDRAFYAGFSNGAMLGYRMVCGDRGGQFRAFVLVGGTATVPTCRPKQARPVLAVNGLKDTVVPYRGCARSQSNTSCARFLRADSAPVPVVMNALHQASGCTASHRYRVNSNITRTDGTGCAGAVHSSMALAATAHVWPTDARRHGANITELAWVYMRHRSG